MIWSLDVDVAGAGTIEWPVLGVEGAAAVLVRDTPDPASALSHRDHCFYVFGRHGCLSLWARGRLGRPIAPTGISLHQHLTETDK